MRDAADENRRPAAESNQCGGAPSQPGGCRTRQASPSEFQVALIGFGDHGRAQPPRFAHQRLKLKDDRLPFDLPRIIPLLPKALSDLTHGDALALSPGNEYSPIMGIENSLAGEVA